MKHLLWLVLVLAPPVLADAPQSQPAMESETTRLRREVVSLRAEVDRLKKETMALRAQITRLRSGKGEPEAASKPAGDSSRQFNLIDLLKMNSRSLRDLVGTRVNGKGSIESINPDPGLRGMYIVTVHSDFIEKGSHFGKIRCVFRLHEEDALEYKTANVWLNFAGDVESVDTSHQKERILVLHLAKETLVPTESPHITTSGGFGGNSVR